MKIKNDAVRTKLFSGGIRVSASWMNVTSKEIIIGCGRICFTHQLFSQIDTITKKKNLILRLYNIAWVTDFLQTSTIVYVWIIS